MKLCDWVELNENMCSMLMCDIMVELLDFK